MTLSFDNIIKVPDSNYTWNFISVLFIYLTNKILDLYHMQPQ